MTDNARKAADDLRDSPSIEATGSEAPSWEEKQIKSRIHSLKIGASWNRDGPLLALEQADGQLWSSSSCSG